MDISIEELTVDLPVQQVMRETLEGSRTHTFMAQKRRNETVREETLKLLKFDKQHGVASGDMEEIVKVLKDFSQGRVEQQTVEERIHWISTEKIVGVPVPHIKRETVEVRHVSMLAQAMLSPLVFRVCFPISIPAIFLCVLVVALLTAVVSSKFAPVNGGW